MIGIPVTLDRLNEVVGGLTRRINDDFHEVELLASWSAQTPQETIEELGFSADDAYLIKLIIDKLTQLRTLYVGTGTLAVAEDFRTQAGKAWGLGI